MTGQAPSAVNSTGSVKTGIRGLDDIIGGGYPASRPSLLRGASGTGKTMFSLMFACANSTPRQQVVYVTFDESPDSLRAYIRQLGLKTEPYFVDLRPALDSDEVVGQVELGGMLVRIEHAVKKAGARCVVLDSFDFLFSQYPSQPNVRRDLLRLFAWCRDHELTMLATTGEDAEYRPAGLCQ